jgi:hypothetical protein
MAKERRAPPYMRWDQRGRPVLQATLKLPDSTEFRAMLNTDDRKIAVRRMQLIVVLLVRDGRLPANSRAQLYGRGGSSVGSRGRGKIPLSSRQADGRLVTVVAGVRLLPFAPSDWVDIVDAAPIPVSVNFGATRHRQMIEQSGQGAFCTVHSQQLCPPECRFPFALAEATSITGLGSSGSR